ncbi:Vacuolar protein sorting-associated protein 13 [Venturia nashicola]|nr:Vacuolar protein sorting-associated protein 13 [Venturia nashicola]
MSPLSPAGAAPAVQRVSRWPMEIKVDGPVAVIEKEREAKEEEEKVEEEKIVEENEGETYTLTLLTTPSLTNNASKLSLQPPTSPSPNVILFPTLPASKSAQIQGHLSLLADKIKAFEVSTGRPTKTHTGQILLGVSQGEREIRRLFVSLRTNWWTLLNEDDRAYQGVGWSLFNDRDRVDIGSVDEIERAIRDAGEVRGWATGLCLWKKREEGWVVEKEFGFQVDDRMVDKSLRVKVRSLMSPSAEDLALKRASSVERRPVSV